MELSWTDKKSIIVLTQIGTLCNCPKHEKCEKKYKMRVTIYTVHRESKYKFVMCELKFQKTTVPREETSVKHRNRASA